MTPFKARVWDKDKQIFIPTDVYGLITSDFHAFGVMLKDWENYKEGEYFYENSQTLSLFAGLKDKNGKEIYEGDIMHSNSNNLCGAVKFQCGCFTWRYESVADEIFIDDCSWGIVIGNIYENPELL